MTDTGDGQVVTFYSYKGGTGRTMALANVAWILAANGARVLVVDWDLESPGLPRFYKPFYDAEALTSAGGVIDLIREFEWAPTRQAPRADRWYERYAKVQRYSFSLNWRQFPDGGTLDFLSAGRQNDTYTAALATMNWDDFYQKRDGGKFLDALRADMKRHYDYTLIDSRTGLSDAAEICTIHLPDVVVACFTLSDQGIEGAARIARRVQKGNQSRKIRILPVPMRVDPAEKVRADLGREVARQRFDGLPAELTDAERDTYWAAVQVPYQAFYAYEETLATFGDKPGTTGMLSAYEQITALLTNGKITSLPPMKEEVRARVNAQYERKPAVAVDEVSLRYAQEDQVWAEWIEYVLRSAGVRVIDPSNRSAAGTESAASGSSCQLTIVSRANVGDEAAVMPPERVGSVPPLAVYVADVGGPSGTTGQRSAQLHGVRAEEAAERILRLVGRPGSAGLVGGSEMSGESGTSGGSGRNEGGPRYPGTQPEVLYLPVRNARFTGRENDLRGLRNALRAGGTTVVLQGSPVALQGMGGIGKTHLALEYAHRFRTAYDVIWWIDADPVAYVDTKLVDLGTKLKIPVQPNVADGARAVLEALNRGAPYARWLVIFDNADDPGPIGRYLPRGPGHVLVTSRDSTWADQAQAIRVDVFERRESIAHLMSRVSVRTEEAIQVAELVGDLPIAVAAAAAWLAETGSGVDEYLRQIERLGASAITIGTALDRSVAATWDLSLERLAERSPAAYRLLQFCSVMAPEIALDLVYSDELAAGLMALNPAVAERLVRGSLVQQISRLALLTVDPRAERGTATERADPALGGQVLVHRLLQGVIRSRMSERELADALHRVQLTLAAARPLGEVDDPNTWPRFRTIWPHLEVCQAVSTTEESVRRLIIDRVRYLWLLGDLRRGLAEATSVERVWVAMLAELEDPDERVTLHRQLLHLRFLQANILRALGEFEQSRRLDEVVLAEQRELLTSEHPHTLMTAGGLAGDLRGLGLYRDALVLDQRTYAAWSQLFSDEHPRTLTALSNLAVSLRLMGDYRGALERDTLVRQRRRAMLGELHPDALVSATAVGRDLRDAGEYERSLTLLHSVHTSYVQVLGPDSRGALNAQANLAVSMRLRGRADDAEQSLEQAYDRLNELFGPVNPDTLACRSSRAANLLALGQNDVAERELTEVRTAYEHSLGRTHPHTLVCVNNLAAVARDMGRTAAAQELARSAEQDLRTILGPAHPYALAALVNEAICTAEAGDLPAALEAIERAAVQVVEVLGAEHPDTLRCLANQAMIRRRLGETGPDADETPYGARLAQRIGPDHPAVVSLRNGRFLHRIIDTHPF